MKKLMIKPGCITCGACEFIAPEVFEVTDISHVKLTGSINAHLDDIHQAIAACPVQVIEIKEQ